jgi:hypothetical protein
MAIVIGLAGEELKGYFGEGGVSVEGEMGIARKGEETGCSPIVRSLLAAASGFLSSLFR